LCGCSADAGVNVPSAIAEVVVVVLLLVVLIFGLAVIMAWAWIPRTPWAATIDVLTAWGAIHHLGGAVPHRRRDAAHRSSRRPVDPLGMGLDPAQHPRAGTRSAHSCGAAHLGPTSSLANSDDGPVAARVIEAT